MPYDAEARVTASQIEARLRNGETVAYEDFDDLGDDQLDDLQRRLGKLLEEPGEGYRLA